MHPHVGHLEQDVACKVARLNVLLYDHIINRSFQMETSFVKILSKCNKWKHESLPLPKKIDGLSLNALSKDRNVIFIQISSQRVENNFTFLNHS